MSNEGEQDANVHVYPSCSNLIECLNISLQFIEWRPAEEPLGMIEVETAC